MICSKSVTNKETKRLEGCLYVAHVIYLMNVTQQSDSILVFLQTPQSELRYNVPSYIINIIKENIEQKQIYNKLNIVHMDSMEPTRAESIHFTHDDIRNISFFCFFFQTLISMQMESKTTRKAEVVGI